MHSNPALRSPEHVLGVRFTASPTGLIVDNSPPPDNPDAWWTALARMVGYDGAPMTRSEALMFIGNVREAVVRASGAPKSKRGRR